MTVDTDGNQETVIAQHVGSTYFLAIFTKNHAAGAAVMVGALPTDTYSVKLTYCKFTNFLLNTICSETAPGSSFSLNVTTANGTLDIEPSTAEMVGQDAICAYVHGPTAGPITLMAVLTSPITPTSLALRPTAAPTPPAAQLCRSRPAFQQLHPRWLQASLDPALRLGPTLQSDPLLRGFSAQCFQPMAVRNCGRPSLGDRLLRRLSQPGTKRPHLLRHRDTRQRGQTGHLRCLRRYRAGGQLSPIRRLPCLT